MIPTRILAVASTLVLPMVIATAAVQGALLDPNAATH